MNPYSGTSAEQQKEMLERCGLKKKSDLYMDIPEEVVLHDYLNLSEGISELEVKQKLSSIAKKIYNIIQFFVVQVFIIIIHPQA